MKKEGMEGEEERAVVGYRKGIEARGALRKWNYFGDLLSRLGPDSNNNGRGEGAGRRGPPRSPEIVGFIFLAEVVSSSKIFFGIRKGDERDVEPRIVFFFLFVLGESSAKRL